MKYNDYFYALAHNAADAAVEVGLPNIKPEWIYCQWKHESANFSSQLAAENHNLGGLTQVEENDSPQPDGNYYYINFNSFEEYALYFGRYLRYFRDGGIAEAENIYDYIYALKYSPSGEYFGDTFENYYNSVNALYEEIFGDTSL